MSWRVAYDVGNMNEFVFFFISSYSEHSAPFLCGHFGGMGLNFMARWDVQTKKEGTLTQSAWHSILLTSISYVVQECCVWHSAEKELANETDKHSTLKKIKKILSLATIFFYVMRQYKRHCQQSPHHVQNTFWHIWYIWPLAQGICSFHCMKSWYRIYE